MTTDRKFSELFYNAISYAGVVLALLVFLLEGFLFALDVLSDKSNIYLELVTYIILPVFLFIGLGLIPLGMWWKQRQIRRGKLLEFSRFRIDLAIPQHRNMLLVFIVGTGILVLMSMIGSYQAFHYTESVRFCGTLCHSVMQPEFTTYLNSPHARVKCVECHIGSGADWYVRSKASGVRQIFKTLQGSYPRPISVPVHNLRPAEETCKQCHWPGKLFSTLDFRRAYFLTQGDTPRWNLRMLLNVGGGAEQTAGLHAHMNIEQDIYYVPDDEKRQEISWVKTVKPDGSEVVYTTSKSPYKAQAPEPDKVRKMDCIDCHNRPSHHYRAPVQLVNAAMQFGKIDPGIPQIKSKAVEVLSAVYETDVQAQDKIEKTLRDYYQTEQKEYYEAHQPVVEQSIIKVKQMFGENMFAHMKARWDAFPDNIGHLNSPGCFRCHDGKHRSPEGKAISRDCKTCHLIVEQGPAGAEEKSLSGVDYQHPDGDNDWKKTPCYDCHTGGNDF